MHVAILLNRHEAVLLVLLKPLEIVPRAVGGLDAQ